MKLKPAIFIGIILSFTTAFVAGYCIGMAFPLSHGSLEFYAAEFVAIVVSMAVFYLAIRQSYRRWKRQDSQYAERLA